MKKDFAGKVVAVTGATAGIGKATAELFRARGATVVCIARRASETFESIQADVTDEAQVRAAIQTVAERHGRLDILVNNAGGGISGAAEDASSQAVQGLFALNVYGALYAAQAAIPLMRSQKSGCILFVSSVAAQFPIPFQAFYSASKAALSSMAGALRNEVLPFGIRVSTLLPGDVKTGFTAARKKEESSPAYGSRAARAVAAMERDEQNGMPPEKIARAVVALAKKRRPPVQKAVGAKYKLFLALARVLPARFVSFLLRKLYA